jgi:hypothetical protein
VSLYERGCAACHGRDGRGVSQEIVGFDTPIPDFTDCSFATPSRMPTGWRSRPHSAEIRSSDEVHIYESVMQDGGGRVTTGLLRATSFAKDYRLLPRGFDRDTAHADIAVVGGRVQASATAP